MAVVNTIPKLLAGGLLRAFSLQSRWQALTTDVSHEFANGGNSLDLAEVTGNINIRPYVADTPIDEAPDVMDDGKVTLNITEDEHFRVQVDRLRRLQAKPAIFEEWIRQATEKASNKRDRFLAQTFGLNAAGAAIDDKWSISGASANRFQYAATPDDTAGAATDEAKAWRQGLVGEILSVVQRMDEANWPTDGRWAVVTTDVKRHLLDYLVLDIGSVGQGQIQDSAIVDAAFDRLFGLRLIVDNQLVNTAGVNNPYVLFGLNSAVAHAVQMIDVIQYIPENGYADAVKARYAYGAVLQRPAHRFAIVQAAA